MDRKKLFIITFAILFPLMLCCGLSAGEVEKGTRLIASAQASLDTVVPEEDINPHFAGAYCELCHEKTPFKGGDTYLKYKGDFVQLCNCHNYTKGTYIHPVFIKPSEEKRARIPDDFPLDDGMITCTTCHDMYLQCQHNDDLRRYITSRKRKRNIIEIMFLRGGYLKKRTDICFKCHDEQKYKMLDPHNQLDANGDIIVEKCLYCHKVKPDTKTMFFGDVELIGDLKILCQRCHGEYERHPGSVNHYLQPSPKLYTRMKIMEGEFGIVLPLDYEGKLTCVTCHNPHERGVIPEEYSGSGGAGVKYRHRLPERLCQACHAV